MKKNLMIVGLLVVAVVAVVGIKNSKKAETGGDEPGCSGGMCTLPIPPEKLSPQGAQAEADVKQQALPKLLDLGAGTCVPCKMMKPTLDALKVEYADRFETVFIDVWENEDAGKQYGIRMIPTQIFYDADGNELFRHEGFMSKEDILAKWQELGINLSGE